MQVGPTITGKKGLVLFHENCRHFRISPFQNLRGPLSYDSETKEYEIADRAFQLALMFVQTRAIAERGRKPSGYEFGKLLEETEYNYKIEEVNEDEA